MDSFEKKSYRKPMAEETKELLKQKKKQSKQELIELRKVVEEQKKEKETVAPPPAVPRRAARTDRYDEMSTRLQNLESLLINQSQSLYEIKKRKELKDQLKAEKKELLEEKKKIVDKAEAEKVNIQIEQVDRSAYRSQFSNLFY